MSDSSTSTFAFILLTSARSSIVSGGPRLLITSPSSLYFLTIVPAKGARIMVFERLAFRYSNDAFDLLYSSSESSYSFFDIIPSS